MPSFFIRNGEKSGRRNQKRFADVSRSHSFGGKRKRKGLSNEEILSEEETTSEGEAGPNEVLSDEDFEDVQETAFRKAKQLLSKIEEDEKPQDGLPDNDAVAHRLKEDALSRIATLHRRVADATSLANTSVQYRAHRFSTVALAISQDQRFVVSCSKDATVVKYDLEQGKKVCVLKHRKGDENSHKGHICAIAISPEDRFLVTGGTDTVIRVWDFATFKHLRNFPGHNDIITGLCFRIGTQQLFSCSKDRTVKAWDLDQMGYVDTMFGHVDAVVDIDVLSRYRVLTCGSQDRTLRLWKVLEQSQLVFNAYANSLSVDCCTLINEDHFASGSVDGSICIWSLFKKKPVCVKALAHGSTADGQPNWIITIAARRYTDLLASGSCDGYVRFWKVANDYKAITNIFSFSLKGFINCLKFSEDGTEVVCAVGQEHKNGRWWSNRDAKNIVATISLNYSEDD